MNSSDRRGTPTPREGARALLQPLQTVLVAWLSLCAARPSAAFPVFFTANGSAVVTSAFGADVLLRPDGGGAVTVGGPLRAQAGLTIGATSLNEATLQTLLSSLAQAPKLAPGADATWCTTPTGLYSVTVNGVPVCVCLPGWSGPGCQVPPRAVAFLAGAPPVGTLYSANLNWYYGTLPENNPGPLTNGLLDATALAALFKSPSQLDAASGQLYVPDAGNHAVRAVAVATATVTTLAGNGSAGYVDGAASAACFSTPLAVAAGADGRLFVADSGNHAIRVISAGPTRSVTTLAGGSGAGNADGTAGNAQFTGPQGLALNGSTLFVADTGNRMVRAVNTATGAVVTIAGSGTSGFADGPAASASFGAPSAITVGPNGTLFVADGGRVRSIAGGVVFTLPLQQDLFGNLGGGAVLSLRYDATSASLYITRGTTLRRASLSTLLETLVAGNPSGLNPTLSTTTDPADAAGNMAHLTGPSGIALDSVGNIFVADSSTIRILPSSGIATLPAGGCAAANAMNTVFSWVEQKWKCVCRPPWTGAACDVPPRNITTLLPATYCPGMSSGGTVAAACLFSGTALARTPAGERLVTLTNGRLLNYSASMDSAVVVRSCAEFIGYGQSWQSSPSGLFLLENGPCTGSMACFFVPSPFVCFGRAAGIAVAPNGTLAVVSDGHVLRSVTLTDATVSVSLFAGNISTFTPGQYQMGPSSTTGTFSDSISQVYLPAPSPPNAVYVKGVPGFVDSPVAGTARFTSPTGLSFDAAGALFVADSGNHAVRRVDSGGVVVTLAGTGTAGFADGSASAALFNTPRAVLPLSNGDVLVADTYNHCIRRIFTNSTGVFVVTLAGTPTKAGLANGLAALSMYTYPSGLALDSAGNVIVLDSGNNRVRQISSSSGLVTTLVGFGTSYGNGADPLSQDYNMYGYGGGSATAVDGAVTSATLLVPRAIAVDSTGTGALEIIDNYGSALRRLSPLSQ